MKHFLIISLLFLNFSLNAQVSVKISNQIVNLSGEKFYLHKVEYGQTLYSISKAYKIKQEEIIRINKLNSTELKSGQLLKIPFKIIDNSDTSPNVFFHKVIKGETLFSLSQKYFITVDEIIETNPDVKYGLKEGQILKIPNKFKKNREKPKDNYYSYSVKKGNTLYSISKEYNVSLESIIKLNPNAENGIKEGQILKIPIKTNINPVNNQFNDTIIKDKTTNLNKGLNDPLYFIEPGIIPCYQFQYSKNKAFKVVVLLPLFLEKNLYYISRCNKEKDPMFYKNTKRFTEFYEGIILALQKLETQGLSVDLKVFDTENDSLKVKNIMNSLDYPNVDLIIGPVYSKNVKIASKYALKHHINLISPLSKNLSLLRNNPFVFQIIPSEKTITSDLAKIIKTHNNNTNVILIYDGSPNQFKLINQFKNSYTQNDTLHLYSDTSVFKIIKYDTDIKMTDNEQNKINHALKRNFNNLIYIPSSNEVFVTQAIDKLYAADDSMKIEIIGSDKWINFQNINTAIFNKLSFNFVSSYFIDYNSPEIKKFIKIYRETYETEPSYFAFSGYDITYYFLNILRKYGRIFQFCMSRNDAFPNPHGLISGFNFERINTKSGFENKVVFILKLNDSFKTEKKFDK